MRGLRTILTHNRGLAAMLVAMALCVRALVPAGYMIAPQARSIEVSICADASGAAQKVSIPLGNKPDAQQDHPGKHSPCAFAGLAMAATDAPLLGEALPPQAAAIAPFAAQVISVGQGLAAPPPHQTGPPAII